MGDLSDQINGGPSTTPAPNPAPGFTLPGDQVTGTTPTNGGVSDFINQGQTNEVANARLATSLRFGQDMAPDRAARVVKQMGATGLPAEYFSRGTNLEDTEAQSSQANFDPAAFRAQAPAVASWVAEHPVNASVAQGDLDHLGTIEKTIQTLVGPFGAGIGKQGSFATGMAQTKLGHLGFDVMNGQSDPTTAPQIIALRQQIAAEPEGHGFLGFLQSLTTLAGSLAQSAKTGVKTGLAGGAVGSVIPGFGTASGAASGFGTGFLADMMRSQAGQSYLDLGKLTDANGEIMNEGTRRAAALSIGLISGALMTVGGKAATNTAMAGFRSLMTRKLATEVAQPSVAASLQRFGVAYGHAMLEQGAVGAGLGATNALGTQAAELFSGQDFHQTLGSVAGDVFHQTLDSATQMLEQMAAPSLLGPAAGFMHDRGALERAQHNAQVFQSLGEDIKTSKTYQRLPAAMQDIVSRITKNGPIENLFIPTDKWNEYWLAQHVDPKALAEKVTGSPTAYDEAMQRGADLQVPTARYASNIAGTEHHAYFAQEVRLGSPDQPNGREAGEYQKQLESAAEEATKPDAEPAVKTPVQQIQEDLEAKMQGKMPARQAATNSVLTAQIFDNLARKAGVDPVEYYRSRMGDVVKHEASPLAGTADQANGELRVRGHRVVVADIPNAGGTSKDGKTVYIDRRIPRFLDINGIKVDVHRMIAEHELHEKPKMDGGMSYHDAHHDSQHHEHDLVQKAYGISAKDYEAAIAPYIKQAHSEFDPKGIPVDLEPKPYTETNEGHLLEGAAGHYGTGETHEQAVGRLQPKGQSLAFEDLLRQHRKAHGDRTPVEGSAEWQQMQEEARQIDADRGVTYDQTGKEYDPVQAAGDVAHRLSEGAPDDLRSDLSLAAMEKEHLRQVSTPGARVRPWGTDVHGEVLKITGEGDRATVHVRWDNGAEAGMHASDLDLDAPSKPDSVSYQQPAGVPEMIRGFIQSHTGGRYSIHLLEDMNESTWAHETGHLFFDLMGELAQRPDAPQQLKDDYQKALEWSGFGTHEQKNAMRDALGALQGKLRDEGRAPTAAEKAELQRLSEPHEKWARGWEAYLREGKAPSTSLRRIFYTMSGWLVRLYRSVSMLNVELNPEIRAVMDRLVASDQEIADARHASGSEQDLFATPEAMGIPADEFHAYRMGKQKELIDARDTFTRELAEEIKAQESDRREEETNRVREQMTTEVSKRPVYQAIMALRDGKQPDGSDLEDTVPPKLSRDGVLSVMDQPGEGKPFLKKLPWNTYRVEGGLHPDVLADRFGYDSGRSLLTAMASAPDRHLQIEAETKAEMERRHPTPFDDGTAQKMAEDAVQNEERGHVLHTELKALSKLAREAKMARFQAAAEAKGKERAKGDERVADEKAKGEAKVHTEKERGAARLEKAQGKISEIRQAGQDDAATQRAVVDRVPDREYFRDTATKVLATKALQDIKPKDYLATARRSSEAAFQALSKKNYAEAAVAKSRELLNHELYREGSRMVTEADKAAKYMLRFDRSDVRARIAKADPKYLDQIDRLTAQYQFRKITAKAMGKLESLRDFVDRIQKEADTNGEEVPLPAHLINTANTVNYRELTHSDVMSLKDSVQMLEHTALWKGKMLAAREAARMEDIKAQLVTSARTNLVKLPPRPFTKAGYTWYDSAKHAFSLMDAELMKMEQLVEWLDGGDLAGPWHQYFWDGSSDAQNREYELSEKVTHKIASALHNIPKEITSKMLDRISIAGIDRPLTRRDVLSVALNWGNDSNASKLMKGHRWSEDQVQAMLNHLTTQEMDFVQGVWDTLDTLRPEIWKLQKDLTGLEPERVEPRSFMHKGKVYAGGYYPVMYDPKDPNTPKEMELSSTIGNLVDPQYARATTPRGHLAERTQGAYEILLDHNALPARIAGVIKDITHRRWLMDANKIVSDPLIRKTLQEHLGDNYDQYFKNWVSQVVNDRNNPNASKMSAWDAWGEKVRMNVLVAVEGFKVSTMLSEWSGINQAIEAIGREDADGHTWLAQAYGETVRDPKAAYAFATSKSIEYKHRIETRNRDFRIMLEQLEGKTGPIASIQHLGLHVLGHAEMLVSLPTWIAGYRKALAQGYEDATAVRAGDMAVRLSHGSGAPKDLAPIMAKKGSMFRALTMFYSTFSGMYNRCRDIQHAVGTARRLPSIEQPKAFAKIAMRTFWIWMVGGALGEVMHGHMGPNKQDGETWPGWLLRKVGMFPLQTIPLVRDLVPPAEQLMMGKHFADYNPTPLTEPITDPIKAILSWESGNHEAAMEKSIKAAGTMFGLPTSQAAVTTHALLEMINGQTDGLTVLHDLFLHHDGK